MSSGGLQRKPKATVERAPFSKTIEMCIPEQLAIPEREVRDSVLDIQSPLQTPISTMMEESLSQVSETPPSSIAATGDETKSRKSSLRSEVASNDADHLPFWTQAQEDFLPELFSENVVAKIWGIAAEALWQNHPPESAPEYTQPPSGTTYSNTDIDFWTSGFFPGSLYLLLERAELYPNHFPQAKLHKAKLLYASRWWSENLHAQAKRTDTHDLGFMIQPSFQKDYELTGNDRSFQTLVTAAESLASRYDERVGAIRSWDVCRTKRYKFEDPSKDYLVIIDNMLNLDLLLYVASKTGNARLANIAITHASTTLKHHIREDWSTVHVVNFDQHSGKVKDKFTNQGYWDDSTWSRGQAWGVLGFAQVYGWTKRKEFLDASKRLARYFLSRLPADGVPHWDFDAPRPTYRDTSAAMIFVSGVLEIYKHCSGPLEGAEWLYAAKKIINSVLKMSLSPRARFLKDGKVDMGGFDAILKNATINNYEYAPRRWADHGLVYADYFLLQVGNKLLSLGLLE